MPRARAYFRYDLFDNVALTPSGATVNRFVPGLERIFHDGMWSLEMRFPFTSAMTSSPIASQAGLIGGSDVTFGDLAMFLANRAGPTIQGPSWGPAPGPYQAPDKFGRQNAPQMNAPVQAFGAPPDMFMPGAPDAKKLSKQLKKSKSEKASGR